MNFQLNLPISTEFRIHQTEVEEDKTGLNGSTTHHQVLAMGLTRQLVQSKVKEKLKNGYESSQHELSKHGLKAKEKVSVKETKRKQHQ